MFSDTLSLVVRNSHPMLSDSSIRRLMRQRNISQRCRNQNTGLTGPMRHARLALRGRHRFPIGLSFLKHPKTSLREVASHSHLRFAVATPRFDSLVKPADMMVATALSVKQGTVGGFHEGPFQIDIDIAAHRSEANLTAAGVFPRHQPTVARQLLGSTETLNGADLGPNHHRQDVSHSRQRLQPVGLGTRSKDLHHLFFNPFQIRTDMIQLIEHTSKRLFGMRRQLGHKLRHDLTSFLAKGIADFFHHKPVFSQRGMHTVFKLRSLLTENHPGARQLAGVTNRRRRDPHRRQVPVLCSRFIPLASSLSLLFTMPIISLANRALTNCGLPPPASISSTTQYQFPTVSTATADPTVHRLTKFLIVP